jgi:hypothetical protein
MKFFRTPYFVLLFIEESWISKSLLLKLPGKELAPNPEKEEL